MICPTSLIRLRILPIVALAACIETEVTSSGAQDTPPFEHPPAQSPDEAVTLFDVAKGLNISLVASEPEVSQPLSISFDDRGRMWVLQYLQYPIPEGREPVEVDQYLRTRYDSVPEPPPHGPRGQDRISIYEDTNGDGRSDIVKHFISDLNLASGMALGHGGVFVVQPPYLLFYPDRDRDDVPDSDPEVLLSGFGLEDAHAFANSLTWGPDGWLYGAQGSTVTAEIRGIGFQQGVWRYHPRTQEFELFAEGGGNTWGLDFDRFGNLFAGGNTVEPLVHHVQGGYYVKGFGKHGPLHNPHTYGYFQPVQHEGYVGDSLTGGFVLYQGGAFPEQFHGACIAPNTRHSASRWSTLETRGSTFLTRAAGDFLTTSDIWFRPVESTVGPDGALYVADWYDFNISHSNPQNRSQWYVPSRFDGRVWRVAPDTVPPISTGSFNLEELSGSELMSLLSHSNDWYARQARQILAERRDMSLLPALRTMALTSDDQRPALQALWSTYVSGGLNDTFAAESLDSRHEYVRAWTVRLLGDARRVSSDIQSLLVRRARDDDSVIVRSQLACTAKRLPADQAISIVRELLRHDEDVDDPHIPLLLWWAIEDKALSDPSRVLSLVESTDTWQLQLMRGFILERLARRYLAEGSDAGFEASAHLLALAPGVDETDLLVQGFVEALSGRNLQHTPASLEEPLASLLARAETSPQIVELGLRLGNVTSLERAMHIVSDQAAGAAIRARLIQTLGEVRSTESVGVLLELLERPQETALHQVAIVALGYFDESRIADSVLLAYPELDADARSQAIGLLCGRSDWSLQLLNAVAEEKIAREAVSVERLRRMLEHENSHIAEQISAHWGRVQPATAFEKEGRITALIQMLARQGGDPTRGAEVFKTSCATCHKLHGQGNIVGPDLTGAERRDREKLIRNLVDPSAVVRQEYISQVVATVDGRILTGLLADSTAQTITVLDAENRRTILSRADIDVMRESPLSLMPEGILDKLTDQQIRDLIAYIQSDPSSQQ